MANRPNAEGFVEIQNYPGVAGVERWRGHRRVASPMSVPSDQFRLLENIRFDNGELRARWGMSKVNSGDSSANECIDNISSIPPLPQGGALLFRYGSSGGGAAVYSPKIDQGNTINTDPDSGASRYTVGAPQRFNSNLYDDSGAVLTVRRNASEFRVAVSSNVLTPTPRGQLHTLTTTDSTYAGEDNLWFAGSDSIYRFTPRGEVIEDTDTLDTPWGVSSLFGKLITIKQGATEGSNHFWYRDYDGTWTAVAIPTFTGGGSSTEFYPYGYTYFRDEILIHGYITDTGATGTWYGCILVWDGTNLTNGTETSRVGSSEVDPLGVLDATVFNGTYYYSWNTDPLGGGVAYIGRYNGSTFTDTHIDLDSTGVFSTTSYRVGGIGSTGNYLAITGEASSDVEHYVTTDLSTWTELGTTGAETTASAELHRASPI